MRLDDGQLEAIAGEDEDVKQRRDSESGGCVESAEGLGLGLKTAGQIRRVESEHFVHVTYNDCFQARRPLILACKETF
jgi:hypothetical protein